MKQFEWKPFAFAFTVNERWNKRDARGRWAKGEGRAGPKVEKKPVTDEEMATFRRLGLVRGMPLTPEQLASRVDDMRKTVVDMREKWAKEGKNNKLVDWARHKEATFLSSGMGGAFRKEFFTPLGMELMDLVKRVLPTPTWKGTSKEGIYLKWDIGKIKWVKNEDHRRDLAEDLGRLGDWLQDKGLKTKWELFTGDDRGHNTWAGRRPSKTLSMLGQTDLKNVDQVKVVIR